MVLFVSHNFIFKAAKLKTFTDLEKAITRVSSLRFEHLFVSRKKVQFFLSPTGTELKTDSIHEIHRMDKCKSFVFPSIEITFLERLTSWCPEINQSERPLA